MVTSQIRFSKGNSLDRNYLMRRINANMIYNILMISYQVNVSNFWHRKISLRKGLAIIRHAFLHQFFCIFVIRFQISHRWGFTIRQLTFASLMGAYAWATISFLHTAVLFQHIYVASCISCNHRYGYQYHDQHRHRQLNLLWIHDCIHYLKADVILAGVIIRSLAWKWI